MKTRVEGGSPLWKPFDLGLGRRKTFIILIYTGRDSRDPNTSVLLIDVEG